MFENKIFRNIFGAKRDEIAGEWRKLHKAELYAFGSFHGNGCNIGTTIAMFETMKKGIFIN